MAGFEVMARLCDQCLLDPQHRIVSSRRAAQVLKMCAQHDLSFECHKGSLAGRHIVCRGQFDTGAGQMSRIAERLGIIVEIDPDTLAPPSQPSPSGEE